MNRIVSLLFRGLQRITEISDDENSSQASTDEQVLGQKQEVKETKPFKEESNSKSKSASVEKEEPLMVESEEDEEDDEVGEDELVFMGISIQMAR
jgi:hypothetical protein